MTLKVEGQPLLVQFGVWTCVVVFAFSFLALVAAWLLAMQKTAALAEPAELRGFKFWERMGRRNSGFSTRFFFRPELRPARRLAYGACAGAVPSFGTLLLLVALFGEQAPQ